MEKNKKKALTYYIIGSAIIWAATIIGCAFILKGSFRQISVLLNSAAAIQLILWSGLATHLKKTDKEIQC